MSRTSWPAWRSRAVPRWPRARILVGFSMGILLIFDGGFYWISISHSMPYMDLYQSGGFYSWLVDSISIDLFESIPGWWILFPWRIRMYAIFMVIFTINKKNSFLLVFGYHTDPDSSWDWISILHIPLTFNCHWINMDQSTNSWCLVIPLNFREDGNDPW